MDKLALTETPPSSTTSVNILDYIYLPKVVKNYIGAPIKGHWLLFDIEAKRNYSNDQFQIYILLDKKTKIVYMKPYIQYYSSEFEKLFGFEIGGGGYDPNKIIVVKNPAEYYEKFEKYF
mgnify:CR=1 FL=1